MQYSSYGALSCKISKTFHYMSEPKCREKIMIVAKRQLIMSLLPFMHFLIFVPVSMHANKT